MKNMFTLALVATSSTAGGAVSAAPPDLEFSYERIADVSTPLPNSPEFTFSGIGGGEYVNTGDSVLFTNFNIGGGLFPSLPGVYRWDKGSGISTVGDVLQPPFNEPFSFTGLDQNYTDGKTTVYRALRNSPDASTIYRAGPGATPIRLFGTGDALPDGAGTVQGESIQWPRVSNNTVLFNARGDDGVERVYRTDANGANVTTFLNENTPGVEGAGSFALGDFKDGYLGFRARTAPFGPHTGVFTSDLNGAVTPIVRLGDPMPGDAAPGVTVASVGGELSHPSISDGMIVYHAFGSDSSSGVFATPVTGGTTRVIVDSSMELPNDNGLSANFGLTSISGDNVSFLGITNSGSSAALFVNFGGTIIDIVHVGDTFDGRVVTGVFTSPFAMSGNTVAFQLSFAGFGEGQGLYQATIIPTPGAIALFPLAGLWAAAGRRRRGATN